MALGCAVYMYVASGLAKRDTLALGGIIASVGARQTDYSLLNNPDATPFFGEALRALWPLLEA